MSNAYRIVRLLKNRLYPTYQLHAFLANEKTSPQDGLRLAALTTMQWLRNRLGEEAPAEWAAIPSPKEYRSAADEALPSLYLNQGHVINIVSLPEKGMWTLQITEPDLGSDPGNPAQARQAVPGRIIETDIAFRVVGQRVECGFKTVVSDPVGTEPEAEVYRLAVVRRLLENPAFGLRQVTQIPMKPIRVKSTADVRELLRIAGHADNQLPCVVFTQPVAEKKPAAAPSPADFQFPPAGGGPLLTDRALHGFHFPEPAKPLPGVSAKANREPPYDLDTFAYHTFSHCRTYVLEQAAEKAFRAQSGVRFTPGDIVVLDPTALGGGEHVYPYQTTKSKREETLRALERDVKASLRGVPLDFGGIEFLSGAREHLLRLSDELAENAAAADAHFRQELEVLSAGWKDALAQKEREKAEIAAQLQRQKEYSARLKEEKAALREEFAAEREALRREADTHLETIGFLRRRLDQPRDYEGIAPWARRHFADRILLLPKAVARVENRAYQCASVELICDALDYLATDYWEMRYRQVPREIALTRCAEKYGRPFEVKPTGQVTIEFTPSEYRVKYFRNAQGEEIDSDLDRHLRVGNDTENLLRIYFLHDDEKQLIVIGSLPDHLRAVTIR